MFTEEKLEKLTREFIFTMCYYLEIGFNQLGKVFDVLSFYVHKADDDERTFEFGPYYIIGAFLVLLGIYFIFTSALYIPPIELILFSALVFLIGIFLSTR